ncbi:ribonuclease H-like domain-containing protein [Tanacetum coccineum]
MDTGVSSHLNNFVYSLSNVFNLCIYPSVSVGDDYSILVTNSGHSVFHTLHRPLHLNNVLITPNIVKNLIYVRQFVRDMYCTVEFDAFGFSGKDFLTRQVLLRCDSTRDLYPVTNPSAIPHAFLTSQYTWHRRLGHSGSEVLCCILFSNSISCNKRNLMLFVMLVSLATMTNRPTKRLTLHVSSVSPLPKSYVDAFNDPNWQNAITLSRHKARLVTNGSAQLSGVDVDEIFSPVVKLDIIQTVLSLAISRHWPVYQLDVKNVFLHEDLSETIYMH